MRHCALALKLPLSTAHGAKGCRCLRIDPLQYAVKMISMVAGTPDERAIVTRELKSGQQPSNAILHMPHVSSCSSHVQEATACH